MMTIRPINEELTRLHQPVVVEDADSTALDGFRVTNSGSVMIPTGSSPPSFQIPHRSTTPNTLSSSYSSHASNPPATISDHHHFAYHGQSPGYASDPYQAAHRAHLYTRGSTPPAHYGSAPHYASTAPDHYAQQRSAHQHYQQQMQMSQAYHMHYGSHPSSWRG